MAIISLNKFLYFFSRILIKDKQLLKKSNAVILRVQKTPFPYFYSNSSLKIVKTFIYPVFFSVL